MKQSKWFVHPVLILIYSILALAASLFLYIYWYVKYSSGTKELIQKFHITEEQLFTSETWAIILIVSILLGIILMGIIIIFIYNHKTFELFRLQNNFINNFTHELKTPVTSLKLYLETFSKYELSRDDQLKYISYMLKDVSRLSDNINSILNTASIESKTDLGEFAKVEIIHLLNNLFKKTYHIFKNCNIIINNYTQIEEINLKINQSLFEMLFMNLITNAVKYNDSATPQIYINLYKTPKQIKFEIIDNGIGIDKEHIKKIFKKFYKVETGKNRFTKGSGLGLYLVHSIIKLHNGKIFAKNREDEKGTIFTLLFPIKYIF